MRIRLEFDLSPEQEHAMEDSVEWAVYQGLLSEEEAFAIVEETVIQSMRMVEEPDERED